MENRLRKEIGPGSYDIKSELGNSATSAKFVKDSQIIEKKEISPGPADYYHKNNSKNSKKDISNFGNK